MSSQETDENEIIWLFTYICDTFSGENNIYLLGKLPFILVIINSIISHSCQLSASVVLIVYIISDIFQVLHVCSVINK